MIYFLWKHAYAAFFHATQENKTEQQGMCFILRRHAIIFELKSLQQLLFSDSFWCSEWHHPNATELHCTEVSYTDISELQQNHTNTIISQENKRKRYPLVILGLKTWPQTCAPTHPPTHTHTNSYTHIHTYMALRYQLAFVQRWVVRAVLIIAWW